ERVEIVARAAFRARQAFHQVDLAVDAEALNGTAGPGVHRDQVAVAGAPIHAFIVTACPERSRGATPVRHAALDPSQAHRGGAGLVALGVVKPFERAGARIERRADRGG